MPLLPLRGATSLFSLLKDTKTTAGLQIRRLLDDTRCQSATRNLLYACMHGIALLDTAEPCPSNLCRLDHVKDIDLCQGMTFTIH